MLDFAKQASLYATGTSIYKWVVLHYYYVLIIIIMNFLMPFAFKTHTYQSVLVSYINVDNIFRSRVLVFKRIKKKKTFFTN